MVEFELPERSFVPEVDEIRINPYRLKQILEDLEAYNKDCRMGLSRTTDGTDSEIPMKYRGRNRYGRPGCQELAIMRYMGSIRSLPSMIWILRP